ncbi:hypothetical protein DEO72_LG6g1158 [Vigna unguiculata]|uniref:Uncharacterized protein n=1 Tax=Vigna unguiculata TaxID=3917 RepID=A0A4D6M5H6_VIGUN|nr:hypothetical protein DEO72_LG6g1158 [Vigna unguiculata]
MRDVMDDGVCQNQRVLSVCNGDGDGNDGCSSAAGVGSSTVVRCGGATGLEDAAMVVREEEELPVAVKLKMEQIYGGCNGVIVTAAAFSAAASASCFSAVVFVGVVDLLVLRDRHGADLAAMVVVTGIQTVVGNGSGCRGG